jgi:hypothetical protein
MAFKLDYGQKSVSARVKSAHYRDQVSPYDDRVRDATYAVSALKEKTQGLMRKQGEEASAKAVAAKKSNGKKK